ncbi:MAG: Zn-ribbon domain-containing OB-fold protein [Deltaproteobacteria bacterium]|jgi:uncharacterized OB-fold protein
MIEGWPLPYTDDPQDKPFWEATRRGELVVQACSSCARLRFPPRPMCPWCQSVAYEWRALSGKGRIWSFAVSHPPLLPVFAERAPYPVIVVEVDEDPTIRMVGNLVAEASSDINEIDPATINIGDRVSVVFSELADDVVLPRWVLV